MDGDGITPIVVGSKAPDFTLGDVLSGVEITLSELRGEVVVLNFWSAECPWSRHYDAYFEQRGNQWAGQDVRLIHIASNTNETLTEIEAAAHELGVMHPILHDPANHVADAYGATMTPQIYLVSADGQIVYQGAVDDRNFRQREATVNYLDVAVGAVVRGKAPNPQTTPVYGCTIVRSFDEE